MYFKLINETRFLVKCGLNESVCNSKGKWNHDECWCECKKLDDWSSCKDDLCGNLVRVIVSVMRHVKLTNI